MKNHILNQEEKELLQSIENISDIKKHSQLSKARKIEIEAAAKTTIQKTKNINIRLNIQDLTKLKAKALENGMPYQTISFYTCSSIYKRQIKN